MKQYCRYCNNAVLHGDDYIWCTAKKQFRAGIKNLSPNKCPQFEFNPIDVFNPDREYKPQQQRRAADTGEDTITENQISLFQEENHE